MTTIRLDLSRHCIETELRKRYSKCLSDVFKADADMQRLEDNIALLTSALETLDFSFLRNTYKELAGHSHATVEIMDEEAGRIALRMDGKLVKTRRREAD